MQSARWPCRGGEGGAQTRSEGATGDRGLGQHAGRTDGRMNGRTDGRTDGRTCGQANGRIDGRNDTAVFGVGHRSALRGDRG